ncbi:MAG: methylated-DNA--[protein]-cysteine S-methyltransferase [Desulfococcaceae bacterium]
MPCGETAARGEIARRLVRPGAGRAVGGANGRIPLPMVIPRHRVVGANGRLTGCGGGLWIKKWLLNMEIGAFANRTGNPP